MFLQLNISLSPVYDEVLFRLKKDEKLLDLGCCFGQDIRKLVQDGVPSQNRTLSSHSGKLVSKNIDFMGRSRLRYSCLSIRYENVESAIANPVTVSLWDRHQWPINACRL